MRRTRLVYDEMSQKNLTNKVGKAIAEGTSYLVLHRAFFNVLFGYATNREKLMSARD